METLDQEYTDIMVDIETTGVLPDRNAMIQLAAVKFNLEKGTVCPHFFNRCLEIPTYRHWDESTRQWWVKNQAVLKEILSKQEDHQLVLSDFYQFAVQRVGKPLRFWSRGSFDYMFVSSYFHDARLPNPFDFRTATDIRGYLRGLHYPNQVPEFPIERSGSAHDALSDTLFQLKDLLAHHDYINKGIKEAEIVEE